MTKKHIAGLLEGPVARLAEPQVSHRVEQAAQGIAWEDWVPLQGGAQYAQGSHPPPPTHPPRTHHLTSHPSPPRSTKCAILCVINQSPGGLLALCRFKLCVLLPLCWIERLDVPPAGPRFSAADTAATSIHVPASCSVRCQGA